jgi:Fe-S-cluster-containing hydrogenase component 2
LLARTGVPTDDELREVTPSPARLARRRVAIVECFQEIPCDPCADACPFGAIEAFANINDRPRVLSDKCVGCALCVAKCPGLAIFVVDLTGEDGRALVTIPYEFLPLPRPGDVVAALDRQGEMVAEVRVVMVQDAPLQDRTKAVWLAVPRELAMTVRNIRVPASGVAIPEAGSPAPPDRTFGDRD